MKCILVTGARGFLGYNVAKHFAKLGYKIFGIGHESHIKNTTDNSVLTNWKTADLTKEAIMEFNQKFDVIVHCAGNGSVRHSIENPYECFKKTVNGCIEVLEYIRLFNPTTHLIYPSSPAVQGECFDESIKEDYIGKPISPYGLHKKFDEDLCQSYSDKYNLNISIVRLFSVYGNGLKKQILWEACNKIRNEKNTAIFWGTGKETRDFIHISDVLSIFNILIKKNKNFLVINGGTGVKHSIKDIVNIIRDYLNPAVSIKFNNQVNIGNPNHYCADTHKLKTYGFKINKKFIDEIKNYLDWAIGYND